MSDDCEGCKQLFESGLVGAQLQAAVDDKYPGFVCERCRVSAHSPGQVQDDESVIFLAIHPIHFDELTKTLAPVAFEQLTRNDLSLLRQMYCTQDLPTTVSELEALGSNERSVELCCVLAVNEIRAVSDQQGRVFGVYDTALPDKQSHASIFVRADFLKDKVSRRRARMLAHQVFKNRLTQLPK